jgi:hypothetical protein
LKRNIALAILLLPLLGLGQSRPEAWKVEDRETIRRSFTVSPGGRLEIDNVNGFIHVAGGAGPQVEATIEKRIRAASKDRLEAARNEVKLDSVSISFERRGTAGEGRQRRPRAEVRHREWRHPAACGQVHVGAGHARPGAPEQMLRALFQ